MSQLFLGVHGELLALVGFVRFPGLVVSFCFMLLI